MASKLRVEFVRLRQRNSEGLQNLQEISDATPVTRTLSGTALTGTGSGATNRVLCPATVNGQQSFHAKVQSDVEFVMTVAPAGNANTDYDASITEPGGIWVPANTPVYVPVTAGQLLSAITGVAFA